MDEDFLLSQGVQPWAELPLWIPDVPGTAGFWAVTTMRRPLPARPQPGSTWPSA
jgi:hypothetical protein